MKVTVWHTNPRELYRVFEGVDRVNHDRAGVSVDEITDSDETPIGISLYRRIDGPPGDELIAHFGPHECWAIEEEDGR